MLVLKIHINYYNYGIKAFNIAVSIYKLTIYKTAERQYKK